MSGCILSKMHPLSFMAGRPGVRPGGSYSLLWLAEAVGKAGWLPERVRAQRGMSKAMPMQTHSASAEIWISCSAPAGT